MAWLTGYAYRAKIPCTATAAGAQTAYTKQLTIVQGSGSNSAGTIYLNSHALAWPNDIRFTKSDGSTALDFYREESDATDGTWHVELDSIGAAGDTDFYCYYGKVSDTDASNGPNAFRFFDDFELNDLSRWTSVGSQWATQNVVKNEGSYAALGTGKSTGRDLLKTITLGDVLIHYMYQVNGTNVWAFLYPYASTTYIGPLGTASGHFKYHDGTTGWVNLPTDTLCAADTFYKCEVAIDFTNALYRFIYIRDGDKGTAAIKDVAGGTPTSMNNILFQCPNSAGPNIYLDHVWARKYAYPEPAWATPTAEEANDTFGGGSFMRGVMRGVF
jgi:hypothetical protein